MRIDTEVPGMIVEIEDKEYPVAARTVAVCEKLLAAEKANVGQPAYRLWREELEILLGKEACRELFRDGKAENVDRLQLIYAGVARAFNHTAEGVEAEAGERRMAAVADALRPVNELLRNMQALEKREGLREIRRG